MNVFLWILQGVLAAAFLGAGLMKLSQPKSKLKENMAWVEDFSDNGVKGIGAAEVLGAIGLILPAATDIAVILTPIAAAALTVTMAGAVITHVKRGEQSQIPPSAVLGILALVVAIFRFGPNSF